MTTNQKFELWMFRITLACMHLALGFLAAGILVGVVWLGLATLKAVFGG